MLLENKTSILRLHSGIGYQLCRMYDMCKYPKVDIYTFIELE